MDQQGKCDSKGSVFLKWTYDLIVHLIVETAVCASNINHVFDLAYKNKV